MMDFDIKATGKPDMRIEAGQLHIGGGLLAYRLDIIEEPHNTKTESETVRRTWRERLLSWPWYPWVSEKTRVITVAGDMFLLKGQVLVVHPRMMPYLRRALAEGYEGELPPLILNEREYINRDNRPYAVLVLILIMALIIVAVRVV